MIGKVEFLSQIKERLQQKTIHELRQLARAIGVSHPTDKKKEDLIAEIVLIATCEKSPSERGVRGAPPKSNEFDKQLVEDIEECKLRFSGGDGFDPKGNVNDAKGLKDLPCEGILYVKDNKYYVRVVVGRFPLVGVHQSFILNYKLRSGDYIKGLARFKENGVWGIISLDEANGLLPETIKRCNFADLSPVYPTTQIHLFKEEKDKGKDKEKVEDKDADEPKEEQKDEPKVEAKEEHKYKGDNLTLRLIDLFAPIGRGQRGLIIAPPNTGKTGLLKQIAAAICANHSNIRVICMLINERPEDVTSFKTDVPAAELYYTLFGQDEEDHVRTAKMVLTRCKNQVECGGHLVVLIDGLSRLALAAQEAGEKRLVENFLATAINTQSGGSLTIIGAMTAQGPTPFAEKLKEGINWRLYLSADMKEQKILPAIDLLESYTSRSELLQPESEKSAADNLRTLCHTDEGRRQVINIFKQKNNEGIIEDYGNA